MSRLLLADVALDLHAGIKALEVGLTQARTRGLIGSAAAQTVTGIARALAAREGQPAPSLTVGLAMALAVHAPRLGHVCVDLVALEEDPPTEGPLLLPSDRDAWVAQVADHPWVTGPAGARSDSAFVSQGCRIYSRRAWSHQARLASQLQARMVLAPTPLGDPALLARGLDLLFRPPDGVAPGPGDPLDRQRLATAQALLGPLLVLTGGPGMGKTWTVRNLLTLLLLEHFSSDPQAPPLRIALAAPTGKAAARVAESIAQGLDASWSARLDTVAQDPALAARVRDVLEGLQATTLHRLLGTVPGRPGRFRHDRHEPLPVDVVVVDEASMVDLALMDRLVDAVPDSARLVLVGDRDQLASVESGCVLADLCGPTQAARADISQARGIALQGLGLPVVPREPVGGRGGLRIVPEPGPWDHVVQLDQTHRFRADSGIAAFVRACLVPARDFDPRHAVAVLRGRDHGDVAVVPHGPGGTLTPALARLLVDGRGSGPERLAGYRDAYELLLGGWRASGAPSEAVFHRRVLDAFSRVRILCAHRQGRSGVKGFNPRIEALLERELPGLSRAGTWWAGRPILVTRNDPSTGLYNGDVGLAVRAGTGAERRLRVVFAGPDALPRDPADAAEGLRLVRYVSPARLPDHETTFAMTIHKSQGSEFDHAVIVLPEGPSRVLTRELVYTGVTRARRQVTVVGSPAVLARALGRPVRRWSGLGTALWGPSAG
jgi:exodeoxyribonuclease V alpha subunit